MCVMTTESRLKCSLRHQPIFINERKNEYHFECIRLVVSSSSSSSSSLFSFAQTTWLCDSNHSPFGYLSSFFRLFFDSSFHPDSILPFSIFLTSPYTDVVLRTNHVHTETQTHTHASIDWFDDFLWSCTGTVLYGGAIHLRLPADDDDVHARAHA